MKQKFHHNSIYDRCSNKGIEILEHLPLPIPIKQLSELKCFEVIDLLYLDFYEGNCIKYLWRLGKKDDIESDLEKIYKYAIAACERNTNFTFLYHLKDYLEERTKESVT